MKLLFDTHAFIWWNNEPEKLSPHDVRVLPVVNEHVFALETLPIHHNDPFDRMLIAQAKAEDLFMVSKDEIFKGYPVKLLW